MRIARNGCTLELVVGDITTQQVDVIANAANPALAGGGGVDGAIHRAAGPLVMRQTQTDYPDGCPIGSAVLTEAGNLPAGRIAHAVGPVWRGGRANEESLLRGAYRTVLELAIDDGAASVALPAISCGVYGYPIDQASHIAVDEVLRVIDEHGQPRLVRFVLFSEGVFGAFARSLDATLAERPGGEAS